MQASCWVFAKTSKLFKSRSAPCKASSSSAQASQLQLDVLRSSVTGVTWSGVTLPNTTPGLIQTSQKTNPKVSCTIWERETHKATFPKWWLRWWPARWGSHCSRQWLKVEEQSRLVLNTSEQRLLPPGNDLQGLITHFSLRPKVRLKCFGSNCSYQSPGRGQGAWLSLRQRWHSSCQRCSEGGNH